MEKETDLKRSVPVVLFNVDRRDRLVDYAVCHSDHECGDYLLRQAELALGGAYVPNESVFCLADAERTDNGLPELLDDYIRKGDIRELPSFDLRSLTFIHETTEGGLPEGMWAILEKTEQLLDDPDTRKALEAYHGYHERRENSMPERKYSINSLVYWVTYVHNVVYSFYRSMIYCYINSTQRCAGSIVIDIIPTNGADKRKFFPFAPYFPVTNVIKRYFYPYFPAIIGIKGYSFPYFPYLSGIMKIKTALYSLFSRLDWHKTVVFPCLGEIYEGIRSLSWEIPVT